MSDTLKDKYPTLSAMCNCTGALTQCVNRGLSSLTFDNYEQGLLDVMSYLNENKPTHEIIHIGDCIVICVAYQYKGETVTDYTILEN